MKKTIDVIKTTIRALSMVTAALLCLACCSPLVDATDRNGNQSQISSSADYQTLMDLISKAESIVNREDWKSADKAKGTPDFIKEKYAPMLEANGSALRKVMDELVDRVTPINDFAETFDGGSILEWSIAIRAAAYCASGAANKLTAEDAATANKLFGIGYATDQQRVYAKQQIGPDLMWGLSELRDSIIKKTNSAKF